MNRTKLGFISLVLAILGAGMAVAFLVVYGISSFTNTLYMWLMVVGFLLMVVFTLVSLYFFLKKDEEISANSKVLDDPKKPH